MTQTNKSTLMGALTPLWLLIDLLCTNAACWITAEFCFVIQEENGLDVIHDPRHLSDTAQGEYYNKQPRDNHNYLTSLCTACLAPCLSFGTGDRNVKLWYRDLMPLVFQSLRVKHLSKSKVSIGTLEESRMGYKRGCWVNLLGKFGRLPQKPLHDQPELFCAPPSHRFSLYV